MSSCLVGKHTVTAGVKDTIGSKSEYFEEFEVINSIKDVYNHYQPLFKNATDFDEWDNEPGYAMTGTKGGYEFTVQIRPMNSDNLNKGSMVYIHLQQQ